MAELRNGDTRERILDVAERLFMEHGYEGTSMRQITGEAAVNLAAVNYHFGSKESLMQEVFRRRLDWLNEERMRVLDALELAAAGQPVKPSAIVEGFFGTLLRMGDDEALGGHDFPAPLGADVDRTVGIHPHLSRARIPSGGGSLQGGAVPRPAGCTQGRNRLALSLHAWGDFLRHRRDGCAASGNGLANRG